MRTKLIQSIVNLKCTTVCYTLPIISVHCFADSENEKNKIKISRLRRRTKKVIDSESTFNFPENRKQVNKMNAIFSKPETESINSIGIKKMFNTSSGPTDVTEYFSSTKAHRQINST